MGGLTGDEIALHAAAADSASIGNLLLNLYFFVFF